MLQREVEISRDDHVNVTFFGEDTVVTRRRGRDWHPDAEVPELELYVAPEELDFL